MKESKAGCVWLACSKEQCGLFFLSVLYKLSKALEYVVKNVEVYLLNHCHVQKFSFTRLFGYQSPQTYRLTCRSCCCTHLCVYSCYCSAALQNYAYSLLCHRMTWFTICELPAGLVLRSFNKV